MEIKNVHVEEAGDLFYLKRNRDVEELLLKRAEAELHDFVLYYDLFIVSVALNKGENAKKYFEKAHCMNNDSNYQICGQSMLNFRPDDNLVSVKETYKNIESVLDYQKIDQQKQRMLFTVRQLFYNFHYYEAEKELNEYLTKFPADSSSIANLYFIYVAQNKPDKAHETFQDAMKMSKDLFFHLQGTTMFEEEQVPCDFAKSESEKILWSIVNEMT